MGEVISLSQYRKDRIRDSSDRDVSGGPSDKSKIRYGLVKSGLPDSEGERVKGVIEFQIKDSDTPDEGPKGV